MRTIVRRDPFENPFQAMTRMFDELLPEPFAVTRQWSEEGLLPLDVSEDETDVIVRASLPGFGKDDVDVQIHDGVLTIKAQQTVENQTQEERYFRRERRIGSLSRRVALPSAVDEEHIKAELRDGVLTLRMPRTQKDAPRKISIK